MNENDERLGYPRFGILANSESLLLLDFLKRKYHKVLSVNGSLEALSVISKTRFVHRKGSSSGTFALYDWKDLSKFRDGGEDVGKLKDQSYGLRLIETFDGHRNSIRVFDMIDEDLLVSAGFDHKICFWDLEKNTLLFEKSLNESIDSFVPLPNACSEHFPHLFAHNLCNTFALSSYDLEKKEIVTHFQRRKFGGSESRIWRMIGVSDKTVVFSDWGNHVVWMNIEYDPHDRKIFADSQKTHSLKDLVLEKNSFGSVGYINMFDNIVYGETFAGINDMNTIIFSSQTAEVLKIIYFPQESIKSLYAVGDFELFVFGKKIFRIKDFRELEKRTTFKYIELDDKRIIDRIDFTGPGGKSQSPKSFFPYCFSFFENRGVKGNRQKRRKGVKDIDLPERMEYLMHLPEEEEEEECIVETTKISFKKESQFKVVKLFVSLN